MNKNLMLILVILGLTSCYAKDESYYRSHPKELQTAMNDCPLKKPQGLTCSQIEELGNRMHRLAYQLQSNPPGFGKVILAMQETVAKQELELKQGSSTPEFLANLEKNKRELAEMLAVVKWLESPES